MNKLLKSILPVFLLSVSLLNYASVFTIGPNETYSSPNALYLANDNGSVSIANGDTIYIEAALYEGTSATAVWHADSLLIRGINGRPHMKANGAYIWQKAIWVTAGNDIRVENIEFSECAVPDMNGAGIRVDGIGLKINNCYFHDNEDGILTSNPYAGNIIVEHSEFNHNGYGDGYSHNIYVGHVDTFVLRFCYMHHAYIGHNVKSRAEVNFIEYNRIMDEYTGQASYLVSLPNGGFSILIGNLFMQGENAENKTLIDYGSEGLSNSSSEFYFVNNTMINERWNGIFISANTSSSVVKLINNALIGSGDIAFGATDTSHNFHFTDTIGLGLADPVNFDYHLQFNSPLINAGTNSGMAGSYSLVPAFEYLHPEDSSQRVIYNTIDVGAYEFPEPTTIVGQENASDKIVIYPNPAGQKLFIDCSNAQSFSIFNMVGKFILSEKKGQERISEIDISSLAEGVYIIKTIQNNMLYSHAIFIKQ